MTENEKLSKEEQDMLIEIVEVFAENLQSSLKDQIATLEGQVKVSDSMGETDRKNYYAGALTQLKGVVKVIDLNKKLVEECIIDGEK
jgi:hypothetical protein